MPIDELCHSAADTATHGTYTHNSCGSTTATRGGWGQFVTKHISTCTGKGHVVNVKTSSLRDARWCSQPLGPQFPNCRHATSGNHEIPDHVCFRAVVVSSVSRQTTRGESAHPESVQDCGNGACTCFAHHSAHFEVFAHRAYLCSGCSLRCVAVNLNKVYACHREFLRFRVHHAQTVISLGPSCTFPYAFPLVLLHISSYPQRFRCPSQWLMSPNRWAHLHPRDDQQSAFPEICRLPRALICPTG